MSDNKEIKEQMAKAAVGAYAIDSIAKSDDNELKKKTVGELLKNDPNFATSQTMEKLGENTIKSGKLNDRAIDKIEKATEKIEYNKFDLSKDTSDLLKDISNAGRRIGKDTSVSQQNEASKINTARYDKNIATANFDTNDKTPQPGA